jgi:hypothetical protein
MEYLEKSDIISELDEILDKQLIEIIQGIIKFYENKYIIFKTFIKSIFS